MFLFKTGEKDKSVGANRFHSTSLTRIDWLWYLNSYPINLKNKQPKRLVFYLFQKYPKVSGISYLPRF